MLGVTSIILAVIALFQPELPMERPPWVDTEVANFPVVIDSMIFQNGTIWDGDHPSVIVGRWQISRARFLVENFSRTSFGYGTMCSFPNRAACFFAFVEPLACYNSAAPTLTRCAMMLSWSPNDEARCEILTSASSPRGNPRDLLSFPIACPKEIRFVR